jgi:hypothetical protein
MISIPLTPQEIVQLLTYHGVLDGLPLINHPWLADRLTMCATEEELALCGLYLEQTKPVPTLWTLNGWKEEKKRREEMAKPILRRRLTEPTRVTRNPSLTEYQ